MRFHPSFRPSAISDTHLVVSEGPPGRRLRLGGESQGPAGAISQPWLLRFLASALVATSFLDPLQISRVPYLHNIGSIVGLLLLISFLVLRGTKTRLREYPGRYIVVFLLVTGVVEGIRAVWSADVEVLLALRVYLQYSQVAVLYLIFFDLAKDPKTIKWTAVAFVISTSLMSMAANLEVHWLTTGAEGGRFGAVGLNLNEQALLYSIAVIAIVGWMIAKWPRLKLPDIVLCAAAGSMLIAMVKTASRAGAVVFVFGLLVALVLFLKKGRLSAYVLLVPVVITGVVLVFFTADVLQERVQATLEAGDTGLRVELAKSGTEMFLERPVFGWGAWYSRDLAGFLGRGGRMAAHNVYLQILLSFGLVGLIPWMLAVVGSVRLSWNQRSHPWGAILLTVFLSTLLAGAAANLGHEKIFWIVLAFAGRAAVLAGEPVGVSFRAKARGWVADTPGPPRRIDQPTRVPTRSLRRTSIVRPGGGSPIRGARGRVP